MSAWTAGSESTRLPPWTAQSRSSDGRAMLIDFGTGLYPEAETLTPPDAYPGTPAYRSPESALFELQGLRIRAERYRAEPSDELYALGVTACRWLTGEYPRFSGPERDAQGVWRMEQRRRGTS
jgi:eukaryotic-like serine/threonine-protein kinase